MAAIKPGVMVMCVGQPPNREHRKFVGTVHSVRELSPRRYREHDCWYLNPPTLVGTLELVWSAQFLKIIDDPSEDAHDPADILIPKETA